MTPSLLPPSRVVRPAHRQDLKATNLPIGIKPTPHFRALIEIQDRFFNNSDLVTSQMWVPKSSNEVR